MYEMINSYTKCSLSLILTIIGLNLLSCYAYYSTPNSSIKLAQFQYNNSQIFYQLSNHNGSTIYLTKYLNHLKCLEASQIQTLIYQSQFVTITSLDTHEIRHLLENHHKEVYKCLLKSKNRNSDLLKRVRKNVQWRIFPGTKWCGMGTIAKDYNDLGEEFEADKCCRAHDNCPHFISSGETKYGFKNPLSFTLNSCSCDDKFYLCLREADTPAAHKIGRLFYDTIRMQCFMRGPVRMCVEWYITRIWCKRYDIRYGVRIYNAQHWTLRVS